MGDKLILNYKSIKPMHYLIFHFIVMLGAGRNFKPHIENENGLGPPLMLAYNEKNKHN